MIKFFFVIIFLAELIIALTVILKIWQLDKLVNNFNEIVISKKSKIAYFLCDLRELFVDFSTIISDFKLILRKKRDEYLLNFAKTLLSYSLILSLKGNYKKTFLAYQLAKEIYEGCLEA